VNYERVQLYVDLLGYGLNFDILRQIPGRLVAVTPENKNCFVITTVNDNLCLWLHQGREESLNVQLALLEHCFQQGFTGFAAAVPLRNGRNYGKVNERCWFYLMKWACFEKVSFRNLDQLRSIVNLITAFHNSVAGWTIPGEAYPREYPKLIDKMKGIKRYLAAFRMLAQYRINATKFDRLYLESLPHLEASVGEAMTLLEKSNYRELLATLKPDDLVINDFSRGNLRVARDGRVRILRVKNLRWDLPVMDLAALLLKSGRSQRWKRCWYDTLLAEYQKVANLGTADLAVVKAYLCFPWNMWHLINRYYLNRVAWPNYLFNDKLERLIADEENRVGLIAQI
jgi:CotS family spore coat protein